MMVMASWSRGMTVPPLSSALKAAIRSCGQSERFNRVRFLTPACAGAGSCPPRGSSRATGWPGVSRDWGRLRYTWEHHSNRRAFKQLKSTRLHGYILMPPKQIRLRYQYLDRTERGKLRLVDRVRRRERLFEARPRSLSGLWNHSRASYTAL